MKKLLILPLLIISFWSTGQYDPTKATATNKPLGIAQAVPTDARSYYYSPSLFIWRPYQSTAEVLSTLNIAKFRIGHFPIYVNEGGALQSNGSFVGGSITEYWFKNGVADSNLVVKTVDIVDNSGTVAQLRAMSTVSGKVYTSTDRGGGTWIDEGLNDGVADDDGAIYIITANGHRLKRQITGPINLKWFGAIGDGIANDSAALWQWAAYGKTHLDKHLYIPRGKYKGSYNAPLILQGQGLIVEGDGSGSNSNQDSASVIFGLVQIGNLGENDHTTRGQFKDFSIFGPGLNDFNALTTHKGTGLTIVKAMESKFTNISVEGFKYGVDVYNTSDASILYAYSITFDHCRFFNNKVANFVWGRVGHQLNLVHSNISYSDYDIVFGVFNKAVDTLIYGNAEPNLTLNVQGNAIQASRKTAIVITNAKKVTIRDNYFEQGNNYQGASEQILIGSKVPTSSYVGNGGGFEDNVPTVVIDANWFFQQTSTYTYPAKYTNIRVVNANGGSITNNQLNNLPYPVLENDGQLPSTYLIRNDSAKLAQDIFYAGNKAAYSRVMPKQYKVVDGGYNSFHGSYTFQFVGEKLPYMQDVGNIVYYKGLKYRVSWLGGGANANSTGAKFGMTVSDVLKLPQITNDEPFITDAFVPVIPDLKFNTADTSLLQSKIDNDLNKTGAPLFNNLSIVGSSSLGGYTIGKVGGGITGNYIGNTGFKIPRLGIYNGGNRFSGLSLVMSDDVTSEVHIGFEDDVTGLKKGIRFFSNGLINLDTLLKHSDADPTYNIPVFDASNNIKWITQDRFRSDLSVPPPESDPYSISKANLSGRSLADANTVNSNDLFFAGGSNIPPGATDGALSNYQYNSSYQVQLFGDWRTGYWYSRGKAGSAFNEWSRFAMISDLRDSLDARYAASNFFFHNAPGTGDSLIYFPNDSTAVAKRVEIIGATKDVTADKITYTIAPNINGTVSFTGDGSTTSFTIPLSVAGLSPTSKIFLTAKTAVGAAINWVDVSTESITIYYLTAPTSGLKTLNYILVP